MLETLEIRKTIPAQASSGRKGKETGSRLARTFWLTRCFVLVLCGLGTIQLCTLANANLYNHELEPEPEDIVISRKTPIDEHSHSSLQEDERMQKDEESTRSVEERITAPDKSQHFLDETKGGDNKNQDDTNGMIPHILLFTYSHNILETKEPSAYYKNVQNTIKKYRQAWKEPNATVVFLDDIECLALIKQHEPRLVKPYQQEPYGAHKGDMCRTVALYQTGGYYFDVDIEVLEPLVPKNSNQTNTTFITSWNSGGPSSKGFFQAVLCVTPKNPIISATIQSMVHDWYYNEEVISKFRDSWYQEEQQQVGGSIMPVFNERVFFSKPYQNELQKLHAHFLGPSTLWKAWQGSTTTSQWLLEEIDLRRHRPQVYPKLKRQETFGSWGCNYLVHDPNDRTPYFYSRIRGTPGCPAKSFVPQQSAGTPRKSNRTKSFVPRQSAGTPRKSKRPKSFVPRQSAGTTRKSKRPKATQEQTS
jgi:mannosyltransferase OCH1-like enzyme